MLGKVESPRKGRAPVGIRENETKKLFGKKKENGGRVLLTGT